MQHQIKINKAAKICQFLPMAEQEIMSSISDALLEKLTAAEIAEVKQCLNKHWHKAVKHAQNEIIGEGCIWSDKHQALLDVVYPKQAVGA
jgi:hypothetical protein